MVLVALVASPNSIAISCGRLTAVRLVERVHVLPRMIPELIDEPIPELVVYDRTAARGKAAFVSRLVAHTWRDRSGRLGDMRPYSLAPGGVAVGATTRRTAGPDHPWNRGLDAVA